MVDARREMRLQGRVWLEILMCFLDEGFHYFVVYGECCFFLIIYNNDFAKDFD